MNGRADGPGRHARSGQAIVEFALVVPVLVLMVFGAIEFGRAYYDLHLLTNAARAGARVGALPEKVESDVSAAVDDFLAAVGLAGGWTTSVTVKDPDGVERAGGLSNALQGDRVQVTVSHDFVVLTGTVLPGFTGSIELDGSCVFRRE
jgi:Flp pilus assembly protein TadG